MSFGASLADHSHGMKFLDKLLEKGTSSITSCFFRKSTHIKLKLETIQVEKLAYDFESFIHISAQELLIYRYLFINFNSFLLYAMQQKTLTRAHSEIISKKYIVQINFS